MIFQKFQIGHLGRSISKSITDEPRVEYRTNDSLVEGGPSVAEGRVDQRQLISPSGFYQRADGTCDFLTLHLFKGEIL